MKSFGARVVTGGQWTRASDPGPGALGRRRTGTESRDQQSSGGRIRGASQLPSAYFTTANASRSTRGRPLVPTTTSLTVRVPEAAQVLCQAMTRYVVVAE